MRRIIFFALAVLSLNGCAGVMADVAGEIIRQQSPEPYRFTSPGDSWCKAHPELAGPDECKVAEAGVGSSVGSGDSDTAGGGVGTGTGTGQGATAGNPGGIGYAAVQ